MIDYENVSYSRKTSYQSMSSKQRKYDVPIDERCIKLIPSAIAYNL